LISDLQGPQVQRHEPGRTLGLALRAAVRAERSSVALRTRVRRATEGQSRVRRAGPARGAGLEGAGKARASGVRKVRAAAEGRPLHPRAS
jgi:hypothetical protein